MPFSIQNVEGQDFPRMVDIFWSSFGPSPLLRATGNIPGPGDPLDREARKQVVINRFTNSVGKPPLTHVLKAVDEETGAIAAMAVWNVFKGPEALAKWRENTRTDEKMTVPPGLKVEGYRYCWERIYKKYKMVFGENGRDHCHLAILATDPAYAGRGVGSLLLDWGCRLADQDGLECHLEATHAGYQLYKRKGFTEALGPDSAIYFDVSHLTGLGGEAGDWVDLTAMIRPPRSPS